MAAAIALVVAVVPAGAGPVPELPVTVFPPNQISPGRCDTEGPEHHLLAQHELVVDWGQVAPSPISIASTISVNGGPAIPMPADSWDPNPIATTPWPAGGWGSLSEFAVSGTATSLEWRITLSAEGYAPLELEPRNWAIAVSKNPAGACAHLYECHPSYEGICVPNDGFDVDCVGEVDPYDPNNLDDGPHYVEGPITVVGYDSFVLDWDGDGIACDRAAVVPTVAAEAVPTQPTLTG